jgi:hypothetical protein
VGEDSDAAIEAVRRYITAIRHIRSRLLDAYPDFYCLLDLMVAVTHTRTMPREGRSSTGIEYSVHGVGCRMTDQQGQEVDVDLVDDAEAFDAWRIKRFLDDGSAARPSIEELCTACSQLSKLGELREVRAGRWYTLPAR